MSTQLDIQRPENDTWKELARHTSSVDQRADSGEDVDDIFKSISAIEMNDFLDNMAMPQMKHLLNAVVTTGKTDPIVMVNAGWIGGFGHGANLAIGNDIDLLEDDGTEEMTKMLLRMYAGVDVGSVDYVANQRVMRMLQECSISTATDLLTTALVAYLDGFQCGFQYMKELM